MAGRRRGGGCRTRVAGSRRTQVGAERASCKEHTGSRCAHEALHARPSSSVFCWPTRVPLPRLCPQRCRLRRRDARRQPLSSERSWLACIACERARTALLACGAAARANERSAGARPETACMCVAARSVARHRRRRASYDTHPIPPCAPSLLSACSLAARSQRLDDGGPALWCRGFGGLLR